MNNLDGIDFAEYLEFVGTQESQSLIKLSDAMDATWERIERGPAIFGETLPWAKTESLVRLRPHEVSLWAGVNGHGKSLVLSQVTAHLCLGSGVAVASLEMTAAAIAERFVRQVSATDQIRRTEMERILRATDGSYWIYDECDSVDKDRILGMSIYAMKELGCRHVVIDSLVKCGIKSDDYNAQKEFVDRLCWAAKTYGGHIHLVHHIRKGSSENDMPGKFDVKGAGELTDLVDNVFVHWRNKTKEEKARNQQPIDHEDPDARLIVCKQRHGEWEGGIKLWFDPVSHQFLERSRSIAERMF
jgi:twinkle protein